MSEQTSPDLPMDLIHQIIHDVAITECNHKSLRQCCLVSKAFYLVARAHIWRALSLALDNLLGERSIDRLTRLCSLLQHSYQDPQITPLVSIVRSLSIRLPSSHRIMSRDYHPPTEEHQHALFGLYPFVNLLDALADVVRLTPSSGYGIDTLNIQGGSPNTLTNFLLWSHLWNPVRDALTRLASAPTVHTICLVKVWGLPRRFLTRPPSLRSLTLIRARIFTETPSLAIFDTERLASLNSDWRPRKIDYLKIQDPVIHVARLAPEYTRSQGLEAVSPWTFLQLVAERMAIKTLDLTMIDGSPAILEEFTQACPCCESLTLRCEIGETKDLPFHSFSEALQHLTLIPTNHLGFVSFSDEDIEWDPDVVCEVFIDQQEMSMSDAIFVPTTFSTGPPEHRNLVLRSVTLHRPVYIVLPSFQPPSSNIVPMAHEYLTVPPGQSSVVSFWEVLFKAVHQIPAKR